MKSLYLVVSGYALCLAGMYIFFPVLTVEQEPFIVNDKFWWIIPTAFVVGVALWGRFWQLIGRSEGEWLERQNKKDNANESNSQN